MTEENKALVRRVVEAINRRDVDALQELVADDVLVLGTEGRIQGRDALQEENRKYLTAFPDLTVAIEDLIAEGDKVVLRSTLRGTHTGDLERIPATGRPIEVPDVDIYRIVGGKAVEVWYQLDRFTLMQQLGLIPEEEGEPA